MFFLLFFDKCFGYLDFFCKFVASFGVFIMERDCLYRSDSMLANVNMGNDVWNFLLDINIVRFCMGVTSAVCAGCLFCFENPN